MLWNVMFLEQLLPDPLTRAAGQRDRALLQGAGRQNVIARTGKISARRVNMGRATRLSLPVPARYRSFSAER